MRKLYQKENSVYITLLFFLFIGTIIIDQINTRLFDQLDYSWQYSINYAIKNHLNFGKGIVFTYGPMGFVSYIIEEGLDTRLIIISWLIRSVYIVYFFSILAEFSTKLFEANKGSREVYLMVKYILIPFMVFSFGYYSEYSIIIFICLIHAFVLLTVKMPGSPLGKFYNNRKILLLAFTGFTVALLFFIKVSFFPFIISVPLIITIKFIFGKELKNLAVFASSILVTFASIYFNSNISLISYILNSLEIIAGYKQAMQLYYFETYDFSYFFSSLIILVYLCYLLYIRKLFNRYNWGLLFIILLSTYFLFVYSYTRGFDGGLIYCFPFIVLVFYLVVYIIENANKLKVVLNIILFILIVSISHSKHVFAEAIAQIHHYESVQKIPRELINPNASYDVYPWNTSYCYFNHLKYIPRPIIQEYSAYTPKLDSINAAFFDAKKVDHIIFHGSNSTLNVTNAIDTRYFMFDEPLAKIQILRNYEISGRINDSLFIVSKRVKPLSIQMKAVKTYKLKLGDVLKIDSNFNKIKGDLFYFTADFEYSTSAKLKGLIRRMPFIKVEIILKSGRFLSFNSVPYLFRNPCILNKFCLGYTDFFDLMNAKSTMLNEVSSIKFYATGSNSNFKSDYFILKVWKLTKT